MSHEEELKRTHHNHPRYRDTVENADKYIEELTKLSFEKLGKNLDIIREQMAIAFKQRKYGTYELLYEWENQNFMARLIKLDEEAASKPEKKETMKTYAEIGEGIKLRRKFLKEGKLN